MSSKAARLAEALELLLRIEWEGDRVSHICPACRRMRMQGHETDCLLARGIQDLKGELGLPLDTPVVT